MTLELELELDPFPPLCMQSAICEPGRQGVSRLSVSMLASDALYS